ncbi:MAG TPA: aminoglycoside phosphotransferase family protein [Acidimicrobiia bacterium]|jgi:aminoglycoside phosphotransferase (APT) family kinase protein
MEEPPAEFEIDEALVSALLATQHPDLAGLSLQSVGSGWDNAIFRLGKELSVRLPRRSLSVPLVLHEQRWLSEIAPRLPLPIPVPIRRGVAGCGFPWPWSITPWFPGTTADAAVLENLETVARQLGTFVKSLHFPAPPGAPHNPYRGTPLAVRDGKTRLRIDDLDESWDRGGLLRSWDDAVQTPEWRGPALWVHGDLHPFNLVMEGDRLSAVLDFGDVCAGDPATDLAVGWMLFPEPARSEFREAVGVDADTWERGRGWAIALGVAWLGGGERLTQIGRRALSSVLEDS